MNRMKKITMGAVAAVTSVSLTACGALPGITVEQIPLPSPGGLGDTIQISGRFDNALNLPMQAKVRLGGIDVGEVTDIVAENYQAVVTMNISETIKVPVGTGAELRQATPLGDVFVALDMPTSTDHGFMKDGDNLTGTTGAAATVEDMLVAITAQVDSGSISSLQTLFTELSTAISGEGKYKELQGTINGFTQAIEKFNKNSSEVDRAMANTAKLTGQLAKGRDQIAAAVNKLPPAIATINDDLGLIVDTLSKSNQVTQATNDFLNKREDTLIDLIGNLATTMSTLDETAPQLQPLVQRLLELTPKWKKSTLGSAATVNARLWYLTPGVETFPGISSDSASRWPELDKDLPNTVDSLRQTLEAINSRLTGRNGAN
ncbi:MAG: MlaD family protein [Gordonia sp. (in: high G+C Gram-positive bacteria)]|uniref:MlaD family protein n=1 Tax=Gordonia sp. (in: high G+C Gram-positive bacteria) TaxID=84139 RepID=UPI0039E2FEDF